MERDICVVREILLLVEAATKPGEIPDFNGIAGVPEPLIDYNLDLLIKEGFVDATASWDMNMTQFTISRVVGLTWMGHDLLNTIREETMISSISEKAKEAGHSISQLGFSLVLRLGESILAQRLGVG